MIERALLHVPGLGEVVCLREVRGQGTRDAREASASRLGVWEWNRNYGRRAWSRVPAPALRGERLPFHARSELRRAALEAYWALSRRGEAARA